METFPINWWAVVAAAIVKIVLGAIWYSPIAFLPKWMAATGVSEAHMKTAFPKAIAIDIVGAFVLALVLLHAVHYAGARTVGQGATVGFFGWLGFIGVLSLGQIVYEQRPFSYFAINNGYLLLSLMIMGAILAVWP
ncbi:MAG TPA: DUF1761 domain-containing protein [Pseudolabrys sp.]|nr:DUF1761 domain-containing protein [Pseudolabrys sp.]